jgi:hypothetical protein
MTRAEAILKWETGIEFISKATTVEEPNPNPPKTTTYGCWDAFLSARHSDLVMGVTNLKSVLAAGLIDAPTGAQYAQIAAITERAAYWAALKQFGVDYITAHPEKFPVQ